MNGKIVRLISDKRFGFIRGEDQEYFFHESSLARGSRSFLDLEVGDPVEFEPSHGAKGPRAENVETP